MINSIDTGLLMGLILVWIVLSLNISFRMLNFPDLTIEGSFILCAAIYASLIRAGFPIYVSILASLLASALSGAFTGFIHLKFRLNKFLAGILTVAICYSLSLRIMNSSNLSLLRYNSIFQATSSLDNILFANIHLGTIILLLGLLAVGVFIIIALLNSIHGLKIRATGSNRQYSKSIGINTTNYLISGLAFTNLLSGFCGILFVSYQGFVDINLNQGLLIIALASMTLGEKLFPSNKVTISVFVIFSAIVGSIAYQFIVAFALELGIMSVDLKMITACMVLFVLGFRYSEDSDIFNEDLRH